MSRRPPLAELEGKALAAIAAWLEGVRLHVDTAKRKTDRVARKERDRRTDPTGLMELLEAMDAVLAGRAASTKDVIEIALLRATPEAERLDLALREMLRARGAPLSARSLGKTLSSYQDTRLANGKRLLASAYHNHSRLWRIAPK